jgi:membrane protein
VDRVKALLAWWKTTRVARALTRYSQANGALLCGGIAYTAIFSVVAAVTIGYTVFMTVLGSNEKLRDSLIESINNALPGLLKTSESSSGIIDPDTLVLSTALNVVSIVSVVVLLFSAISCMGAIRSSVRVMFGLPSGGGTAVHTTLREFGGLVTVGLAVLVSAVVSIGISSASSWLLSLLGAEGTSKILVPILGYIVSFAIDAGMFILVVILLAGIHPPRRDRLIGATVAAIGFGVIRFLGTSVVAGGADKNAFLASFAVVVTLLIWINVSARILLTAAAITANLPLEILESEASEDVARAAIEEARAHERGEHLEHVAPADDRTITANAPGLRGRLVALMLAASAGVLIGRRASRDTAEVAAKDS